MKTREFNIIIWGCTGLTGRLVAMLLARRYGLSNPSIRVALAGRSEERLRIVAELMLKESLKSENVIIRQRTVELQESCQAKADVSLIPMLVLPGFGIDKEQTHQMASDMAQRTDVILSLAGPYSLCGEPIVRACAEQGTDYVDVTGEYEWVKLMHQRYNKIAQQNSACILPCCGFGYLLNDIGLAALQRHALYLGSLSISYVEQHIRPTGERVSQGTLKSILNTLQQTSIKKILFEKPHGVYEMCDGVPTSSHAILSTNKDRSVCPWYSSLDRTWMRPTYLGRGMTRYIHWTNEIKNYCYGKEFMYQVGEASPIFTATFLKAFLQSFFFIILKCVSHFEFCSKRLIQLLTQKSKSDEVSGLEPFQYPKTSIELKTIGLMKQPKEQDTQKIEHIITFDKGDEYLMTAYGALEVALTCLKKKKQKRTDASKESDVSKGADAPKGGDVPNGGVGCPSQLLGTSIEENLRLEGFQMVLKLNPV